MGLESVEGLRAVCQEISSEQPSPGGGTASAAAGAMAASLLIMVCGITAKSKKNEAIGPELRNRQSELKQLRDDLIRLAAEDAAAYDRVMASMRMRKEKPGKASEAAVQDALVKAAQVPLATAEGCMGVLRISQRVAEIGTKSAKSDVGVGILLAGAGLKGAAMNVRINAVYISDKALVEGFEGKVRALETESDETTGRGLTILSQR